MHSSNRILAGLALVGFVLAITASSANAQAKKKIKDMKDVQVEGKLLGMQRGVMALAPNFGAETNPSLVQILSSPVKDDTGFLNASIVFVNGTSLPDGLRGGGRKNWYARITATVDESGIVKEKISEISVFTPLSEADISAEVTPGVEGELVGKIAVCAKGKLTIIAHKGKIRKITAPFDEDNITINLAVADPSLIKPGDYVKVSAKEIEANKKYIAVRVDVTMALPYTTLKRRKPPAGAPAPGSNPAPFGEKPEVEKAN